MALRYFTCFLASRASCDIAAVLFKPCSRPSSYVSATVPMAAICACEGGLTLHRSRAHFARNGTIAFRNFFQQTDGT